MVVDQLSIAAGGLTSNKPVRRAASPEMVRVPAPELRRLREEIIELRSQLAELLSSPDLTMHLSRRFRLTTRAAALLYWTARVWIIVSASVSPRSPMNTRGCCATRRHQRP